MFVERHYGKKRSAETTQKKWRTMDLFKSSINSADRLVTNTNSLPAKRTYNSLQIELSAGYRRTTYSYNGNTLNDSQACRTQSLSPSGRVMSEIKVKGQKDIVNVTRNTGSALNLIAQTRRVEVEGKFESFSLA